EKGVQIIGLGDYGLDFLGRGKELPARHWLPHRLLPFQDQYPGPSEGGVLGRGAACRPCSHYDHIILGVHPLLRSSTVAASSLRLSRYLEGGISSRELKALSLKAAAFFLASSTAPLERTKARASSTSSLVFLGELKISRMRSLSFPFPCM